jgi:hypothetical protein
MMRVLRTSSWLRCMAPWILAIGLAMSASAAIKTEPIPELKPPRGVLKEVSKRRSALPWIAAAACLAGAAVLLLPVRRKPQPVESLYDRTARELRGLREPDPQKIGELLRAYICEAFGAPGPGQTFEELAALLTNDPRWTPLLKERLRRVIDPLEIARFAPAGTPADMEKLREEALALLANAESLRHPPVVQPA